MFEFVEMVKDNINNGFLFSIIVVFVSYVLYIVCDLFYGFYFKVNIFLIWGLYWSLDKLFLVDEILIEEFNVGDVFYI